MAVARQFIPHTAILMVGTMLTFAYHVSAVEQGCVAQGDPNCLSGEGDTLLARASTRSRVTGLVDKVSMARESEQRIVTAMLEMDSRAANLAEEASMAKMQRQRVAVLRQMETKLKFLQQAKDEIMKDAAPDEVIEEVDPNDEHLDLIEHTMASLVEDIKRVGKEAPSGGSGDGSFAYGGDTAPPGAPPSVGDTAAPGSGAGEGSGTDSAEDSVGEAAEPPETAEDQLGEAAEQAEETQQAADAVTSGETASSAADEDKKESYDDSDDEPAAVTDNVFVISNDKSGTVKSYSKDFSDSWTHIKAAMWCPYVKRTMANLPGDLGNGRPRFTVVDTQANKVFWSDPYPQRENQKPIPEQDVRAGSANFHGSIFSADLGRQAPKNDLTFQIYRTVVLTEGERCEYLDLESPRLGMTMENPVTCGLSPVGAATAVPQTATGLLAHLALDTGSQTVYYVDKGWKQSATHPNEIRPYVGVVSYDGNTVPPTPFFSEADYPGYEEGDTWEPYYILVDSQASPKKIYWAVHLMRTESAVNWRFFLFSADLDCPKKTMFAIYNESALGLMGDGPGMPTDGAGIMLDRAAKTVYFLATMQLYRCPMSGCSHAGYGSRASIAQRYPADYGPRPEKLLRIGSEKIQHLELDDSASTVYMSIKSDAMNSRIVSIPLSTLAAAKVDDMTKVPLDATSTSGTLFQQDRYVHDGFSVIKNSYQASSGEAPSPSTCQPPTPAPPPTAAPTAPPTAAPTAATRRRRYEYVPYSGPTRRRRYQWR